jgi:hypothetical protein
MQGGIQISSFSLALFHRFEFAKEMNRVPENQKNKQKSVVKSSIDIS